MVVVETERVTWVKRWWWWWWWWDGVLNVVTAAGFYTLNNTPRLHCFYTSSSTVVARMSKRHLMAVNLRPPFSK